MLSVLILTLNEEKNLPSCLASIANCDDIVILDSGSTDRTQAIAQAAGAKVITHPFADFGSQRNYAQTQINFKHPWVFHLDADEHMTPELWSECVEMSRNNPPTIDGYWVAPKMIFEGKWIPRSTDYPAYQARFVRAPGFRFIQVGHGQREAPEMRMAHLNHGYLHDLSSEPVSSWLAKHRRYADEEAAQHYAKQSSESKWRDLLHTDSLKRRRAIKNLSYKLPFRPTLRLLYQYILRGGFLDGAAGYKYCLMLRRYEQFVDQARKRISES